jgi:hypothetical protein
MLVRSIKIKCLFASWFLKGFGDEGLEGYVYKKKMLTLWFIGEGPLIIWSSTEWQVKSDQDQQNYNIYFCIMFVFLLNIKYISKYRNSPIHKHPFLLNIVNMLILCLNNIPTDFRFLPFPRQVSLPPSQTNQNTPVLIN